MKLQRFLEIQSMIESSPTQEKFANILQVMQGKHVYI